MTRFAMRGIPLLGLACAALGGHAFAHRALKPDVTMKSIVGVWDGLVGKHAVARMEIEGPTKGRKR
jgi:hypothetical protein